MSGVVQLLGFEAIRKIEVSLFTLIALKVDPRPIDGLTGFGAEDGAVFDSLQFRS